MTHNWTLKDNFLWHESKPLGKLRRLVPSFGTISDYGLKNIFLGIKLFCFSRQKFQHLFEKEFLETSQNFNSIWQQIEKISELTEWVLFLKKYDLGHSLSKGQEWREFQQSFAVPIFIEGFDLGVQKLLWGYYHRTQ